MKRPLKYPPQVGEKYFNLTVVDNSEAYVDYKSGRRRAVLCKCVCGTEKLVTVSSLLNKHHHKRAKSCGCNAYYPGQSVNVLKNNPDKAYWEMYRGYKSGAKRRNLKFKLSKDELKKLANQNCYYCNCPPQHRNRNGIEFYANGIDRIDSRVGYIIENCVPCCSTCNNMKWESSKEDFLAHIDKIVRFNNLK